MKIKFLKSRKIKAFGLALGISVGFLVMSFLAPFYLELFNEKQDPIRKNAPETQKEHRYTEVRGMN